MGSEKSTSDPLGLPSTATPEHTAQNPRQQLAVAELFSAGAPEDAGWVRVDSSLSTYWRLLLLVNALILIGIVSVLWLFASQSENSNLSTWVTPVSVSITLTTVVLVSVWLFILIGRRVASIGYRLRDRELEVSSGIMFQRLVSVPFARMQLVEVTAGPIERIFGIAGVQLHTASATTNAKIPGLTPKSALSLRDSLNTFGEQAGL